MASEADFAASKLAVMPGKAMASNFRAISASLVTINPEADHPGSYRSTSSSDARPLQGLLPCVAGDHSAQMGCIKEYSAPTSSAIARISRIGCGSRLRLEPIVIIFGLT